MLLKHLLFEADVSANPEKDAKDLIAAIDNPNTITRVTQWLQDLLNKIKPQQEPNSGAEEPMEPLVTEDINADKKFAVDAIGEIAKSGDVQQLNSIISFLRGAEITELTVKWISNKIKQGVKGNLDQKLSQLIQNINAPYEQKEAFLNKVKTGKGLWDGTDLLKNSTGYIYNKLQSDPILRELITPLTLQLRGAMGYGPDQGPGEFLLALTGDGIDLAEKSDLILVDGTGVEVKADGKAKTKSGWSRSGGRLYSTSGYGAASTARIPMFKAMVDNGVPAEAFREAGWPVKKKDVKYAPSKSLNFNKKGTENLNELFSQYLDRKGVQEVMRAMITGLYTDLPAGYEEDFINSVSEDGTLNYSTMMMELIALAHEYYKHQEGHDQIMIFNTFTGGYIMMGTADSVRDHWKSGRLRTNSGFDFFDDRSKGTPQLLTGKI